jgi:hypothetical protein
MRARRSPPPKPYPVRPAGDLCSWVDCPNPWVTIGVGHDPAIMPVDEYGETAFCRAHLLAWQLHELTALAVSDGGPRARRSLAERPL